MTVLYEGHSINIGNVFYQAQSRRWSRKQTGHLNLCGLLKLYWPTAPDAVIHSHTLVLAREAEEFLLETRSWPPVSHRGSLSKGLTRRLRSLLTFPDKQSARFETALKKTGIEIVGFVEDGGFQPIKPLVNFTKYSNKEWTPHRNSLPLSSWFSAILNADEQLNNWSAQLYVNSADEIEICYYYTDDHDRVVGRMAKA